MITPPCLSISGNKQQFLLNWGEIWGLKGARKDLNPLFFFFLPHQNRLGCRGAFDVCFGSANPTLEYVLGRPLVTCLQAESQSPGSWSSLMKYFRELLTPLMPMCTLHPPPFLSLSLPSCPPPPHHPPHIPRILFERLITRTLSLCSRGAR